MGWLNDKEVVRYSEQRHIKHTIESQTRYLESFTNSSNCFWAVIQKVPTDEMIGSITAYIDPHNSVADVGILIGSRGHWGARCCREDAPLFTRGTAVRPRLIVRESSTLRFRLIQVEMASP